MLTFYLVRHWETESNLKWTIMGQLDSPLTEEWLLNAKKVSEKLRWIQFDYTYSSDLWRAFRTLYIITKELWITDLLLPKKELREIDYWIYSNMDKNYVKKECREYKKDVKYVFYKWESFELLQKRVIGFIKNLEKENNNKTILIVWHSWVIRSIICYFNSLDFQENLKMKISHEYIWKFVLKNGVISNYEKIND